MTVSNFKSVVPKLVKVGDSNDGLAPVFVNSDPSFPPLAYAVFATTAVFPPALATTTAARATALAPSEPFGVNLDGLEFGSPSSSDLGVAGTNYFVPTKADIDALAADGSRTLRVPFSWERLQPTLGGPLDPTYLGYLKQIVAEAQADGMKVLLDCHNYGAYNGQLIGSAGGPTNANFASLWGDVATAFAGAANVGFDLMNEPQQSSASGWLASVNAAIGAIGAAQTAAGATVGSQEVLISSLNWDGASSFASSTFAQLVQASLNASQAFYTYGNTAFEVHQYFDPYSSGTDTTTPLTDPLAGVTDLLADTAWGTQNNLKLFLGETAVPRDAASQTVLSNLLDYMAANPTVWQGMAYWTASPYYPANYGFNIDPTTTPNAPQVATIEKALASIQGAVWVSGSNISQSVNNGLVFSTANVANAKLSGSADTVFLNSGFSGAMTGNNDVIYATGDNDVVAAAMTDSGVVTAFGSADAVSVSGADVATTLSGPKDTAVLNGSDDTIAMTGGGTAAAAESATLNGLGETANSSGAYDAATLQGVGTSACYESATATGAYESVSLLGAYNRATLSGMNAIESATLSGADESVTLLGSHNTATAYGSQDLAVVGGISDIVDLYGSNDSATLTGANCSALLTGTSNSASLNGVETAATAEYATLAGKGDLVNLNGAYNSATMNGVGTGAVHDTVQVNGGNESVNLKGAYNFASLNGLDTASTAETAGVSGADDSITLAGAYNSALLYGVGSSGIYELATATGADDSVTLAGNFDGAVLTGTADSVTEAAAHDSATLTGAGDALTMGGCYNSATVDGANDTANLTGFDNTVTIEGSTTSVTTSGANNTFVFDAGFGQTTLTGFANNETGATHDSIAFASSEFANFSAVLAGSRNVGANTVISGGHGDALTLIGVQVNTLAGLSGDFWFHG